MFFLTLLCKGIDSAIQSVPLYNLNICDCASPLRLSYCILHLSWSISATFKALRSRVIMEFGCHGELIMEIGRHKELKMKFGCHRELLLDFDRHSDLIIV